VLTRKTKSIILPHLFGNPADTAPIVELARSRKISVIDDAAQALGATIDGQPAGSFGDAGILSFGPEKISSGLGGGALVFRTTTPCRKLRQELAPPSLPSALGELFSNLFWSHWRRLPNSLRNSDPGAAPKPYRRQSLANVNAVAALRSMETLEENVAARRARVCAYQKSLGGDERFQLIAHKPGSACLTQLVRVLPRKRGVDLALRAIDALGKAGFEVQGSYVPIHLLGDFRSCVWDRLPHTDRVWADLIELPCEPSIDFDDIERIAATVRKVVS
jgi:dTDP-4-amino-4,6-dideoxygalactose transaminase